MKGVRLIERAVSFIHNGAWLSISTYAEKLDVSLDMGKGEGGDILLLKATNQDRVERAYLPLEEVGVREWLSVAAETGYINVEIHHLGGNRVAYIRAKVNPEFSRVFRC